MTRADLVYAYAWLNFAPRKRHRKITEKQYRNTVRRLRRLSHEMPEPTERQKRIKELAGVQRTKRWRENRIAAGKNPSPSYMDLLQEQYEVAWKSIRFSLDQPAPSLVILHS